MRSLSAHEQRRLKHERKAGRHRFFLEPNRVPRDQVELFLEQTQDPDPAVRGWAVRHLCPCRVKSNHQAAWDRLIAMACDADASVRRNVLHILTDGSPRVRAAEVVQAVESMHDDPDPDLRRSVRKWLARYRRTGNINAVPH